MLTICERADRLAGVGPPLVVTLSEMTGDGWIFIPQDAVDFAVLSRRRDRMQLGMLPGRYDSTPRFEFSPFIRIDGITHTLAGLGTIAPTAGALRIHVTMARGVETIATNVIRRLIVPYEGYFPDVGRRVRNVGRADRTRERLGEDTGSRLRAEGRASVTTGQYAKQRRD
jgi:hypothetical protein